MIFESDLLYRAVCNIRTKEFLFRCDPLQEQAQERGQLIQSLVQSVLRKAF